MMWIRKHWNRISTGMLLVALAGLGGEQLYRALSGDCCSSGAACCKPGAACCKGHAH